MEFLRLAQRRQSVRQYLAKDVEREKIERCLEAARLAPSASNSQPWRFIVVDRPDLRKEVAAATFSPLLPFNRFVLGAPALVAVVGEPVKPLTALGGMVMGTPFALLDLGLATAHLCLQATEEGLGTCILGWFDQKRVKRILGVPAGRKVALVIAVGYPATEEIRPKSRKPLGDVRNYNAY